MSIPFANFAVAGAMLGAFALLPLPAAANPSAAVKAAPADKSLTERVKSSNRSGVQVDAPLTTVTDSARGTSVDAPTTSVRTNRRGTWVRAPFVNIFVPKRY